MRGTRRYRALGGWLALAMAIGASPLGVAAQDSSAPRRGRVQHVAGTRSWFTLAEGDVFTAGTCGLDGASSVGHSTLTLQGPSGATVVEETYDSCETDGALVRHRVTADTAGAYALIAGCWANEPCGGVIAYEIAPEPVAIRRGRVEHVAGRSFTLALADGDVLRAGTCGIDGASSRGPTTLRLQGPSGRTVIDDTYDSCDEGGARLSHEVPAGSAGDYALVAVCWAHQPCAGVIAYEITPGENRAELVAPHLRLAASARAMVAVDRPGGALMLDAVIEWRAAQIFIFRLAAAPIAVAGGEQSGIAAGAISLVGGLTFGAAEVAIGGGAAVLATRLGDPGTKEVPILALHGRVGSYDGFLVDAQVAFASFAETLELFSLQVTARLALGPVDLTLRGVGGHDGIGLGEAGAVIWLALTGSRPTLGLSVHAGAGGVFYQPVCRFGAACTETRWYVGPVLGAGLEWRP